MKRLAEALRAAAPSGTPPVAVCFLDIDHFKHVNDSRGHAVGDSLLAEVARRIAATARAGDVVARFGGDEFAVLAGRARAARIGISVNVSNRQLEHDQLIAEVASVLEETGVPPEFLVLEITESLFMRDLHAAVRRLNALRRLGVRVATYDFGIGFSSLNSLSRLPIDVVKVDKSFVDGIGTRYDAVIGAVVGVAEAFDLDVVAEGVERPEQLQRLKALGCHFAPGFLLGRPVPADEIDGLLPRAAQGLSSE